MDLLQGKNIDVKRISSETTSPKFKDEKKLSTPLTVNKDPAKFNNI
jgi:hypothetical protein